MVEHLECATTFNCILALSAKCKLFIDKVISNKTIKTNSIPVSLFINKKKRRPIYLGLL